MRVTRKLYDANLQLLDAELEMVGFPEEVLWLLRISMPMSWPDSFSVEFETEAYGHRFKGTLWFQQMRTNSIYRFSGFDVELTDTHGALVKKHSFERMGYAVNLREAINLMHGRPVYRDPERDALSQGYWFELRQEAGDEHYTLLQHRTCFLSMEGIEKALLDKRMSALECLHLADKLDAGDRVLLEMGGSTVFVEIDLARERLLFRDSEGRPVQWVWRKLFYIGR